MFTQTHGTAERREAPLDGDELELFDDDDEDPTKVLAPGHDAIDTEVALQRPPPRPPSPPRPKRKPRRAADDSFVDEVANVSVPVPVGAADRVRGQSTGHPISATQIGPTLVPFGRYHLVKRLAFGGMGEIWLAAQRAPGGFSKLVAIKRLLSHYQGDTALTGMFFDEARLQALLSDRHIVQIYDMGEEDDHLYIAMEYVHGVSFKQILDRAKANGVDVPLGFLCDLAVQACRGFAYAHNVTDARGEPLSIVHRDVNPHNLLASFGGEVKLIDFGIAKSEMSAGRTETGTIKGKFAYMSPEQSAAEPLDRRSDIFSLGIVLYELISGENPFHRQNVVLSLEAIQRYTPPPIESLRPEAHALAPIVNRALQKRANERYGDCSELAEDLLQVLESGVLGRPPCSLSEWLNTLFAKELAEHAALLAENGVESGFVRRAPAGTYPGQSPNDISDFARRTPSGALPPSPRGPPPPPPAGVAADSESAFEVELVSDLQPLLYTTEVESGPSVTPLDDTGRSIESLFDEVIEETATPPGGVDVEFGATVRPALVTNSQVPPDTSPTSPGAIIGAQGIVVPPQMSPKKKRSKVLLFLGASLGAFLTVSVGFVLIWALGPAGQQVTDDVEHPEALPEAVPPSDPQQEREAVATGDAAKNDAAKNDAAKNDDVKNDAAKDSQEPAENTKLAKNTAGEDGVDDTSSRPQDDGPDGKTNPSTDDSDDGTGADDGTDDDDDTVTASKARKDRTGRRRRRAGRSETPQKTSTDAKDETPPKSAASERRPAVDDKPKAATALRRAVVVKTLKGSANGSPAGTLAANQSKTFRAKNDEGMEVELKITATATGAVVVATAKPWAIVRTGSTTRGRTPVSGIVIDGRSAVSFRHPKNGEISMIVTVSDPK